MIIDLHCHSDFSFDSDTAAEELCRVAFQKKIGILSITDHCEFMKTKPIYRDYFDIESRIINENARLREKYAGRLTLLHGVEIGNPHNEPELVKGLLCRGQYDFVLGSLHFLEDDTDPYFLEYTPQNADGYLKRYFSQTEEMVDGGDFDCLGHIDYMLRFMQRDAELPKSYLPYSGQIVRILEKLAVSGRALEINLRPFESFGRLLLEPWVLKAFRDAGGKYITIGSDAHSAAQLANGYSAAVKMAAEAGFDALTIYKKRLPEFIPI